MTVTTLDIDAYQKRKRSGLRRQAVTLLPEPADREIWFPFISVDDHVLEPKDLFEGRVPRSMRERAPKMRLDFDGQEGVPYWQIDDGQFPISIHNGAAGRPITEWDGASQMYTDFRPGVSDPHARLHDMDIVGAWASLCFPSIVWGFAGRRFSQMKDPAVGLASLKAYNDWMLDEWCSADLSRFIPCQLPWLRDPAEAALEIRRNADRGFKAVSFSENPAAAGFGSIHTLEWDPFFAACQETNTVINLHVGSSGAVSVPDPQSPSEVTLALFPVNAIIASVDWVYSRIPIRFPELRIVLSEGGASWVPTVMERLGRAGRQREISKIWAETDPSPVDVFLRSFWFASLEDPSAFQNLKTIGSENVMIECDYPHGDSTWPDTQDLLKRDLGHLSDIDLYRVCISNAAGIYRHPTPPTSWIENSTRGQSFDGASPRCLGGRAV